MVVGGVDDEVEGLVEGGGELHAAVVIIEGRADETQLGGFGQHGGHGRVNHHLTIHHASRVGVHGAEHGVELGVGELLDAVEQDAK